MTHNRRLWWWGGASLYEFTPLRNALYGLLVVYALLTPVASLASQQIEIWIDGSRVRYRFFDPARNQWISGAGDTVDRILWAETDGRQTVGWVEVHGAYPFARVLVCYAAYSPAAGSAGQWVTGSSAPEEGVNIFIVEDGVVAWKHVHSTPLESRFGFAIFDPSEGTAGQWNRELTSWSTSAFTIDVADATVSYVHAGQGTTTKGYRNGAWQNGMTQPLAWFRASRTNGPPPLSVWFIDQSLGVGTLSWDFGPGQGTSTSTCPQHTFSQPGAYTVMQTIRGPHGTNTHSVRIVTDVVGPTGTVQIAGGVPTTPTDSVVLALVATDNVAVAEMMLRNQGSSWGSWEPYSASKTWTLESADGTKVVEAQFRDAVGNVSATFHDSIELIRDTDVDGLPDSWELRFFGDATGALWNVDADHDGHRNMDEVIAGTDPTNANSVLQVNMADNQAGMISWGSVSNRTYTILGSSNLLSPVQSLMSGIDATPPTNVYPNPFSTPEAFFMIEVMRE